MEKNRMLREIDPSEPYTPWFSGISVYEFKIGRKERRMITYVPKNVRASTAGVYLFPPSGVTAEDFLRQSNWIELADTEEHREKMVLFVLEAAEGGNWEVEKNYGAQNGDLEYIWKAFEKSLSREICCVYEGKRYLVGYREGGAMAVKFAMDTPADIAGIVSVDAPRLPEDYIQEASAALCPRLHNYVDLNCRKNIRKGQIPMHAWFISEQDIREWPEVQFWKRANETEKNPRKTEMDTWEYFRKKPLEFPYDDDLKGYQIWITQTKEASAQFGHQWNRKIWKKFLYPIIRWAANPGGSFRKTRDPVDDLGMEYHYEKLDGWMREWYIHIPEIVKRNPDVPAAVVIVFHGYTCTGELCTGNADWYKVGEKYGFITVYPTGLPGYIRGESNIPEAGVSAKNCPLPAWNIYDDQDRPSDLNFTLYILEKLAATYCIDRSRIFVTGTSMGNLMTQYVILRRPDIFAAAAPTSGIIHMAGGEVMLKNLDLSKRPKVDIPVWMFGGEMEEWLLDAKPEKGNRTWKTLAAWWKLNRMPGDMPTEFKTFQKVRGRWNDWIYEKNGMPMVRFTGIDYYPHATNPEMSYRIWEEFFSKFKRKTNGEIDFLGE